MKKVLAKKFLAGMLLGASLWLPLSTEAAESQQELNEQDVKAVLWMQTSAEYRQLCYQAYNIALREIEERVKAHTDAEKPLAIILDIDETVLDNSPLMSGCIGTKWLAHDGQWKEWCEDELAEPMPGAVEFLKKVDSLGVKLFYITGRVADREGAASMRNLKKIGFPQISETQVLLAESEAGGKAERFLRVEKDYEVILYMGDSITDFPLGAKGDVKARAAVADLHQKEYGTKYIVLPNPTYGGWEKAVAKGYEDMTPAEKDKARKAALKHWKTHD